MVQFFPIYFKVLVDEIGIEKLLLFAVSPRPRLHSLLGVGLVRGRCIGTKPLKSAGNFATHKTKGTES
jgi:hypothetical protein